jgi:hypothetical protein
MLQRKKHNFRRVQFLSEIMLKTNTSSGSSTKRTVRTVEPNESSESKKKLKSDIGATPKSARQPKSFSTIKDMAALKEQFDFKYDIKKIPLVLEKKNAIKSLTALQLNKLSSGIVQAQQVVPSNGEKSLCFPIYDLLKVSLLLTNLKMDLTGDNNNNPSRSNREDEDEDESFEPSPPST